MNTTSMSTWGVGTETGVLRQTLLRKEPLKRAPSQSHRQVEHAYLNTVYPPFAPEGRMGHASQGWSPDDRLQGVTRGDCR